MKPVYSLLVISLMWSCKNDTTKPEVPITQNPMNEELTDTRNYEADGNFEEDVYTYERKTDSINENWNLNNPERQMGLYARFNMSDAQQEKYETALSNWFQSQTNEPYEKLGTTTRIEAEDSILKPILDEHQYENYQAWAQDNDKR
ncbi:hypothetical protein [Winogradskyella arenosi]|uniref:Uncharacterized protein n=1 Tax=Winogradskyella arenosi TaxID=533325 RepID=A0A368ZDK8_9FLAO|nr:hypothetical protein [Winogradskyella arenosi]RCW91337.1 hypothetical protein DFQ08_103165 [Winogradskyella arenosi]